jgi:outer membrane lipoprotein-sorting protein
MIKSIESMANAKTVSFTFNQMERYDGEQLESTSDLKITHNPLRVYMKFVKGSPAKELLYNSTVSTKAKINPGKLIPTISMKPLSDQMRKKQHHTLLEAGYSYMMVCFINILKGNNSKRNKLNYLGEIKFQNADCFKLTFLENSFGYYDYTIKNGETLHSVAKQKAISEYLILEKNRNFDISDYKEGKTFKIPNVYASKGVLIIDKATMLPRYIELSDDKGVFERYTYSNIKVNPKFTEEDFSEENKNYGF